MEFYNNMTEIEQRNINNNTCDYLPLQNYYTMYKINMANSHVLLEQKKKDPVNATCIQVELDKNFRMFLSICYRITTIINK